MLSNGCQLTEIFPPSGVYLMAFDSRLTTTCDSMWRSMGSNPSFADVPLGSTVEGIANPVQAARAGPYSMASAGPAAAARAETGRNTTVVIQPSARSTVTPPSSPITSVRSALHEPQERHRATPDSVASLSRPAPGAVPPGQFRRRLHHQPRSGRILTIVRLRPRDFAAHV